MNRVKHNQYVTIPDWFADHSDTPEATESKRQQIIVGGASTGGGIGNVTLHNKFVLSEQSLTEKDLVVEDKAVVVVTEGDITVGTLVDASGWSTSDYITVAANTQMEITCTKHAQYGIVFYNYNKIVVSAHSFIEETNSSFFIDVPETTYSFRISNLSGDTSFAVIYQKPIAYDLDQLEIAHENTSDFVQTNKNIPEGIVVESFTPTSLNFLVENPLQLNVDLDNVIRLTLDYANIPGLNLNEMFEWDKKYAAFGYNASTGMAYSYTNEILDVELDASGNEIPVFTADVTKWMYDDQKENQWIIKTTRKRFSILEGLIEFDEEKDCFFFHKNIVTSGGVTMYADLGDIDIPSIYDGLPIDNDTIKWKYDDTGEVKVLTANIKAGGIKNIINGAEIDKQFVTGLILSDDGTTVSVLKSVLEVDDIPDLSDKYVDRINDQTVSGWKDFLTGIKFNGIEMRYLTDNTVYLNGNLIVSGGVTLYGDVDSDIPSILESIPTAGYQTPGLAAFNEDDFIIENGVVSIIGETGGSIEYPLSVTVNNSNYTFDGTAPTSITINNTTLGLDELYLRLNNVVPTLKENNYRQIIACSEDEVGGGEILYIIV